MTMATSGDLRTEAVEWFTAAQETSVRFSLAVAMPSISWLRSVMQGLLEISWGLEEGPPPHLHAILDRPRRDRLMRSHFEELEEGQALYAVLEARYYDNEDDIRDDADSDASATGGHAINNLNEASTYIVDDQNHNTNNHNDDDNNKSADNDGGKDCFEGDDAALLEAVDDNNINISLDDNNNNNKNTTGDVSDLYEDDINVLIKNIKDGTINNNNDDDSNNNNNNCNSAGDNTPGNRDDCNNGVSNNNKAGDNKNAQITIASLTERAQKAIATTVLCMTVLCVTVKREDGFSTCARQETTMLAGVFWGLIRGMGEWGV
ncbi:hypothetical protein CBR_g23717 [Chara braunii]|uniref:Uncharacterized protein n=1 Tax=Chara braunii TaxID=69332 RepID=A0A388L507_CHABU|nr:hypothetical protein CBR_g23717 [Chara braunii]|eukprot:GBG77386.1 hypothetical protein CBR_g23717 [Chara braunii]